MIWVFWLTLISTYSSTYDRTFRQVIWQTLDDGVPHRILAHQVAKFAELCHLPRYIACQERFLRTTFKRLPIFWNISF